MIDISSLYKKLLGENDIDNNLPPIESVDIVMPKVEEYTNTQPVKQQYYYDNVPKSDITPVPQFNNISNNNIPLQSYNNALNKMVLNDTPISFNNIPELVKQTINDKNQGIIDKLKQLEGFTPISNWDYKQFTNGYGTKALYNNEVIDEKEAQNRLVKEIDLARKQVSKSVDIDKMPDGVVDALVSQTFNMGSGAMNQLYKTANECAKTGDYTALADRMKLYNKAGGKLNEGLVNRRNTETGWFMSDG